jgi:hypothetical protein
MIAARGEKELNIMSERQIMFEGWFYLLWALVIVLAKRDAPQPRPGYQP